MGRPTAEDQLKILDTTLEKICGIRSYQQRIVLTLVAVDTLKCGGSSHLELAEALGISQSSFSRRLARGLIALGQAFGEDQELLDWMDMKGITSEQLRETFADLFGPSCS